MKTFSEGQQTPWGINWFAPGSYANLFYRGQKYLTICFRLPFYWIDYDAYYDEKVWGSAVFRWHLGFRKPEFMWWPDYKFDKDFRNLCERS